MLRSAVGNSSNELNEVSVSSQGAEHLQASDSSHSAEQPLLEVSVEQNRQSDSSERAEHDRSSFDNSPNIERQPRSRGTSPTSIDSGRGQPMRSRSHIDSWKITCERLHVRFSVENSYDMGRFHDRRECTQY